MILDCPKCSAQFYIEDGLLGDQGRKVKCSACGETWHQMPATEEDDSSGDIAEEIVETSSDLSAEPPEEDDPVDEALERAIERLEQQVEPEDASDEDSGGDESYRPSGFTESLAAEKLKEQRYYSYASAFAVFLVIFIGLMMFSSSVLRAYPSAQAFYGWFGYKVEVASKDLIFDQIETATDGAYLRVTGKIVNLGNDEVHVPPVIIVAKDSHQEVVGEWLLMPKQDVLPAQAMVSIDKVFDDVHLPPKDNYNIHLRYAMDDDVKRLKIGGEGDGNSQAHHQGESDYSSGHAKSEGYHPHASSDVHPESLH